MATQTYNYESSFTWRTQATYGSPNLPPSRDSIEAELKSNMEKIAIDKFTAELAKTGHWYKINTVTTEVTKFLVEEHGYWTKRGEEWFYSNTYTIEGTTTVNFDTDIPDAKLESSPSLLAAISIAILAIAAAIMAHPLLFLTILLVIAFAILVSQLTNITTGLTNFIKEPAGAVMGIIGTVGILIILLILLMWFAEPKIKARKRRKR